MISDTLTEMNEGNWIYILMERLANVTKEDIKKFEQSLAANQLPLFQKMNGDGKRKVTMISLLSDKEHLIVHRMIDKRPSYLPGIHDILNYLQLYSLLTNS